MYEIRNFADYDDGNDDIKVIKEKGPFKVIEYVRDLSVHPGNVVSSYFAGKMNIRRRQVVCDLNLASRMHGTGIKTQAGAMQWTVGDVDATTGIRGVGDFMEKIMRSKVTNESAVKPEYVGSGQLILEPTYKHIILVDVGEWNGSIVLEDGMFLACESCLREDIAMRANFSSAAGGKEGLFNLCLAGQGIAVLESPVPEEELVEVQLVNDVLKIDGPLAVCWSNTLNFTVERSGRTLLGSAASGEGLVNVYRGTGKVWLAPVRGV